MTDLATAPVANRKSYQSFSGEAAASNSAAKLKALYLPADMKGKSVLDIGCNEGFFLFEAARRGATRLMGIDHSERFVTAAKERAAALDIPAQFERMDAYDAPAEGWDYILVLSVLHYFDDPMRFFDHMRDVLAPDGLLIFEGGIVDKPGRTMQRALRSIDDRFFPTARLMTDVWLRDWSVKRMGPSVNQNGDPVPRHVLHCRPRRPRVILVLGDPGDGKTELSQEIDADVVLSTDVMLRPVAYERSKPNPYQARYAELMAAGGGHVKAWPAMREDPGAVDYFAGVVANAILLNRRARTIAIEGYILGDLREAITAKLGSGFKLWTVKRANVATLA